MALRVVAVFHLSPVEFQMKFSTCLRLSSCEPLASIQSAHGILCNVKYDWMPGLQRGVALLLYCIIKGLCMTPPSLSDHIRDPAL
jgi:hypothetical protein